MWVGAWVLFTELPLGQLPFNSLSFLTQSSCAQLEFNSTSIGRYTIKWKYFIVAGKLIDLVQYTFVCLRQLRKLHAMPQDTAIKKS